MGGGLGAALSAPQWPVIHGEPARRAVAAVRAAKLKGYKAVPGQVGITRGSGAYCASVHAVEQNMCYWRIRRS